MQEWKTRFEEENGRGPTTKERKREYNRRPEVKERKQANYEHATKKRIALDNNLVVQGQYILNRTYDCGNAKQTKEPPLFAEIDEYMENYDTTLLTQCRTQEKQLNQETTNLPLPDVIARIDTGQSSLHNSVPATTAVSAVQIQRFY